MKTLVRLLAALSLGALAACAPASTQTSTPQVIIQTQVVRETQVVEQTAIVEQTSVVEVPAGRVEVRLSGWVSSPAETALLESLLYKFSVENPDILVKYEPITGDFWATLNTLVATGQEPDIYYMDIFQFPAFAENEVLLPLDDCMASQGISRSEFVPSLIDAFTYDGVTLGLPKDFNTLGLFYNKGLFADAGVPEPTDNWTWDNLRAAAEAVSDPANGIYGLGVPADAGRFPIFAFQNGGAIMTDDLSDTRLDDPATVEAAAFYTSFRADEIGATPADLGEGWQGTVFGKGQFAMVYEGGWLIPYLRDTFPNVDYGVVVPPAGPGGEGNLIFTVAYSVSRNSANPEAACRVVSFLTNEASQNTVLESGFALPTRASLAGSQYLADHPNSAAIFRGATQGARPFMWGPVGSDVNDQMGKALERVYLQNQPVADALAEAAAAVRAAIADQ